ncbi:MAG: hypothetical protein R3B55_01850 [Candidatus Paceibacterota bacterium]
MMDIRQYSTMGYNKKSDDFITKLMKDHVSEMDWDFIREHKYSDEHKKKLNNFDTLAQQMTGKRFGFFSEDGTVLSGIVTGFSWNKSRVVMYLQLQLDVEPDAKISYSIDIHSGLQTKEDTVFITDEGMPDDPILKIAANSLRVEM